MAVWSVVNFDDLTNDYRFDAEYYKPDYLAQEEHINKMRPVALSEVANVTDGNHLAISEQFCAEGVRYLRGQDLSNLSINETNPVHIPESEYEKLPRSHMKPGDVLLSIVGTIGSIALVPDDCLKLTGSCKIAIIRPCAINSYFLAAYLASNIGQAQIARRVRGAVQQGLILPDLKQFPVPRVTHQQASEVEHCVKAVIKRREQSKALYAEAENTLLRELHLDTLDLSYQLTYERTFSEMRDAQRYDADYFQPKYQNAMAIMGASGKRIQDVAFLAKRPFRVNLEKIAAKEAEEYFEYIEIGNLSSNGKANSETVAVVEAPSRAQWVVCEGDVITSTVRPIRRLSALIEPEQESMVCSSGFAVLKPYAVEPEILLLYLRLPIVCEILDLYATASMYPAISTANLLNMPITLPNVQSRHEIISKVQAAKSAREDAKQMLEDAKKRVEEMVLSGA